MVLPDLQQRESADAFRGGGDRLDIGLAKGLARFLGDGVVEPEPATGQHAVEGPRLPGGPQHPAPVADRVVAF